MARFRARCAETSAFFRSLPERYADPTSRGVVVIDWSENYFNGIGDEMQHYQEMLAIGLGTGRAAYLQTQRHACVGTGLGGAPEPPDVAHLASECRFDLGDYFAGVEPGVDWKWDATKRDAVRAKVFGASRPYSELVVTWGPEGMTYDDVEGGFEPGKGVAAEEEGRDADEDQDGDQKKNKTVVAPPDANLLEIMMNDARVQAAPVVRLRVKQSFGHWCHPHQRGDWGMCESYRFAVGVENHAPENRAGGAEKKKQPPCPACVAGFCFGAATLHPRPALKRAIAPYLARIDRENWSALVGAHVRVGFADMSQVPPPTDEKRALDVTLDAVDAFLAEEARRVPYPSPKCPAGEFGGVNPPTLVKYAEAIGEEGDEGVGEGGAKGGGGGGGGGGKFLYN